MRAGCQPVRSASCPRPAATRFQKASPPTVSATRWMRLWLASLITLWLRQVSKIQHSPAAMLMTAAPHSKRTVGWVTIGTCTRTRSAQ